MYVKITNGAVDQYPYSIGHLRRDNPNVSFPRNIPEETLAEHDVFPVVVKDYPSITDRTQKATSESEPTLVDGQWTIGWVVEDKTAAEVAAYDDAAAAKVRTERDRLLVESDWVSIRARELGQDIPIEWYTYRGDLRQIPEQDGFPHSVVWPVKPQ